jgi:hypothetical protein
MQLKKQKNSIKNSAVLPSSALRKQQQLTRSICSRKSNSVSAVSATGTIGSEGMGGSSVGVCKKKEVACCTSSGGSGKMLKVSNGSVKNTIDSSSINSSDIRNCNRLFLKNYE